MEQPPRSDYISRLGTPADYGRARSDARPPTPERSQPRSVTVRRWPPSSSIGGASPHITRPRAILPHLSSIVVDGHRRPSQRSDEPTDDG
uniref:Uncharacterized protein n=1 Tax=Plectus sambesii TaxID=2011161 RepID=A0A914UU95_9BILA